MATRRKGRKPSSRKLTKAELRQRSLKGWKTRRYRLNPIPDTVKGAINLIKAGANPDEVVVPMLMAVRESILNHLRPRGGIVRSLAQARLIALEGDSLLNGKSLDDWESLKSMVRNNDERWLNYMAMCELAGFDSDEARDYWFSPEM